MPAGLASATDGVACAAIAALTWDEDDAEDDSYTRKGWVVGLGGSYGIESFDDAGQSVNRDFLEPPTVEYSTDDSFALLRDEISGQQRKLRLGERFAGWTLRAIHANHVEVWDGESKQSVALRAFGPLDRNAGVTVEGLTQSGNSP